MKPERFQAELLKCLQDNIAVLQTPDKEWVIKGFIDIYQNVYAISLDTKVISKIIEILLFPVISDFAKEHHLEMILAKEQNYYPDISFKDATDNTLIALDIKSTYRQNERRVNGFTLGAFTGYFRDRQSTKNITFKYDEYMAHFVLGVIYTRNETSETERQKYTIAEMDKILSVISDIEFIVQEKFRIASARPGSGNTKNIGSVTDIEALRNGSGPFSAQGVEIFDDYWRYYRTRDMGDVAYSNLAEYCRYKKIQPSEPIQEDDE